MQKKYYQLTKQEKQDLIDKGILNGFGPEIKKEYSIYHKVVLYILRFLLRKISRHFDIADSYYHDYGYYIGGDEKKRRQCDLKFHYFICRDVENGDHNKIKKVYLYFLASIFFISVRLGGKNHFNYL